MFQCMTHNPFGAAATSLWIAVCFNLGPKGINPILVTASKIELVRLVRDGKKDADSNIVLLTNMNEETYC